jgi:hypothetical protein
MGEVRLSGPSMEQRIANRLKNSGEGSGAETTVQHGSSDKRVFTNIHAGGHVKQRGDGGPEKPMGRSLSEGDPNRSGRR